MPSIVTLTMNPTIDTSTRVDHVVAERKLRCASPGYEPGGGGINVTRAIAKLGGEAAALYLAGGPPGQLLQSLLDQERLTHDPTPIEGWTRESLTVYEASTGQQFRFGMPGPTVKEGEWRSCLQKVSQIHPKPDFIVASGSLPPGVPKDFYARVAHFARDLGSRMIVDTSGEALRLAVQEGVYLIKPNLREFKALAEHTVEEESQQIELAKRLVSRGQSQVVVLSLGAAGALFVWKDGHRHLRAPTVSIKSKVGAGDSMVAGIVLSLSRGFSLVDAVRFGVAAGAGAVMTPGTELCHRQDVEKLYEGMRQDAG
jgi:6-phosphofructokinase 2